MAKPISIPNTFASATSAIPLSQLDQDFSTLANATNDLATYSNYVADTGAADAYIANFPANTNTASLTAGLTIQFKAANANTGASTLNVQVNGSTIGTAAIRYANGSALAAGAIAAGAMVSVMYDGTNFQLINDPAGQSGGDVTGPASATDNAIARFDGATGKLIQNSVVTIADTTGDMSGVGTLSAGNVTVSGTANAATLIVTGNSTLGDASGDTLTITGTTVTTPNGLNFDSDTLVIDAANNLVGIGTSSPTRLLSVNGAIGALTLRLEGSVNPYVSLNDGTNTSYLQVASSALNINVGGANPITFTTNSSERMRITSTGNVGIGTNNPSALLHVSNASAKIRIGVDGSSQYTDIFRDNSTGYTVYNAAQAATFRGHIWQLGGSEAMRIDSSGNVGIGTSSPAAKLDVRSTAFTPTGSNIALLLEDRVSNSQALQFYINDAGTYASSRPSGAIGAVNSFALRIAGGGVITGNFAAAVNNFTPSTTAAGAISVGGNMDFFTAGSLTAGTAMDMASSLRMRIDSAGRVGIGTSSPASGLSLNTYGTAWTGNTVNTYPVPAGNVFLTMQTVPSTANWFGTTGTYGATSGSSNLLLQVNLNNTSQQAGNYIGSEAASATSANLTFGAMIGGSTVGGNSTKSEFMRIDSSGNVGINTSSLIYKLEVNGTGRFNNVGSGGGTVIFGNNLDGGLGTITAPFNSAVFTIANTTANPIAFNTGGTERMRIDSSGNVGIGTGSPATKLQVSANSGYVESRVTSGTNDVGLAIDGSNAYLAVFDAIPLQFQTNSAERMRITSGGDVLTGSTTTAGTTNPTAINLVGRLRSTQGQTASIANGATVDITLTYPKALVAYLIQSNVNTNHMSAGFFRSNDNGASSAFTLFSQSETNVAVTSPAVGTIRITNNTGGTVAFNYAFTIIASP